MDGRHVLPELSLVQARDDVVHVQEKAIDEAVDYVDLGVARVEVGAVVYVEAAQIAIVADFSDLKLARIPPNYADDMKFMRFFYPGFKVCSTLVLST